MRRNSIGLRQTVEGTIDILQGASFDPLRRDEILAAMTRLVSEAEVGSASGHDRVWANPPLESDALDSYFFVESYLPNADDLEESLTNARDTIESVKANNEVAPDKVAKSIQFFTSLLEGLRTERRRDYQQTWVHRVATPDY